VLAARATSVQRGGRPGSARTRGVALRPSLFLSAGSADRRLPISSPAGVTACNDTITRLHPDLGQGDTSHPVRHYPVGHELWRRSSAAPRGTTKLQRGPVAAEPQQQQRALRCCSSAGVNSSKVPALLSQQHQWANGCCWDTRPNDSNGPTLLLAAWPELRNEKVPADIVGSGTRFGGKNSAGRAEREAMVRVPRLPRGRGAGHTVNAAWFRRLGDGRCRGPLWPAGDCGHAESRRTEPTPLEAGDLGQVATGTCVGHTM
jgi:hypothetical protein